MWEAREEKKGLGIPRSWEKTGRKPSPACLKGNPESTGMYSCLQARCVALLSSWECVYAGQILQWSRLVQNSGTVRERDAHTSVESLDVCLWWVPTASFLLNSVGWSYR